MKPDHRDRRDLARYPHGRMRRREWNDRNVRISQWRRMLADPRMGPHCQLFVMQIIDWDELLASWRGETGGIPTCYMEIVPK